MRYSVWCKRKDGAYMQMAMTRFEHDARDVLANWHDGYIILDGEMIFKKGDVE